MFGAMNESYAAAEANVGEGAQGEWPPEGDHDVLVMGVTAKVDSMKKKDGMKIPCLNVQFTYEWERTRDNDPDWVEGKPALVFRGEVFRLVPKYETQPLEEGQKTAARIAEERFKGHSSKLLRKAKEECVDSKADFAAIYGLLSPGQPRVAAQIRVQYRAGNVKKDASGKPIEGAKAPTYKTEFILDRLA